MNDMTPGKHSRKGSSLIERAATAYDLTNFYRAAEQTRRDAPPTEPAALDVVPASPPVIARSPVASRPEAVAVIDRQHLAEQGLLVPGAPIGPLAEEFRLIKRQLLITAETVGATSIAKSGAILVCSAQPNDGKTYCAINLAISLAAGRDIEVLLIDADFAKGDILIRLGINAGPGLLDALADTTVSVEDCVIPTDIAHLSVLPAGTKTINDTELLASSRTAELIDVLLAADPNRILIFDSPPVMAASPASVLASHVGQVMLVVRADRTSDSDVREAVAMLDGCEHIQLVLNAVSYAPGARRFGNYYDQEDAA
ncbi:MAG: exopolysaccharide biosynthesis protein [Sphingomonas sp.]